MLSRSEADFGVVGMAVVLNCSTSSVGYYCCCQGCRLLHWAYIARLSTQKHSNNVDITVSAFESCWARAPELTQQPCVARLSIQYISCCCGSCLLLLLPEHLLCCRAYCVGVVAVCAVCAVQSIAAENYPFCESGFIHNLARRKHMALVKC